MELEKDIRKFIWGMKRLRIKYKLSYEPKEKGGAALPNLQPYYKAAAIIWIKEWMNQEDIRLLDLERIWNDNWLA